MKILLALGLLFISSTLLASSGEHGGAELHAIPYKALFVQIFNFSIMVIGLIVIAKQKVKDYFQKKGAAYVEHIEKAKNALKQAELNKAQAKEKLVKLNANFNSDLQQAKVDTENIRNKMIKDAQEAAKKIIVDAEKMATLEAQKAMNIVREQLLEESALYAEKALKEKVGNDEQKRLQNEFVEKIQVAR